MWKLNLKRGGKKPAKRKGARRWPRPSRRIYVMAGLAACIAGVPAWLWYSGMAERGWNRTVAAVIDASVARGYSVQEVTLAGRKYSGRAEVMKAIRLARGYPMLTVDPATIRSRLLALPWVAEARVIRNFPSTVSVSIREREPMALWQRRGKLVLVDMAGEPITSKGIGHFRHLLIIAGDEAPKQARTLFALLGSEPGLAKLVVGAEWISKRRWNLTLKGGIRVRLPEKTPHAAWQRLARMNEKHRLLKRDIQTIDMRLPDRTIIRPGEFGRQTAKGGGQRT